ncbi:putative transcription factor C2H2 family [Medicago truncatula]|uniref:Putative transcription factor C2H2 family n=1 Tax=Medicago truncatula TaxID=3880 RepID=A0A396JLE5_MEDTR|nr:putative transcription factor C2H2 family [Medicago truncatula]
MRKKGTPSCSFYNPCSSFHSFDDNEKSQRSRMYDCDLCGKKFNSGNALGGHKTSHRRSQPLHKKQRHDHAINKDDDDDEKQKYSCPVCNKVFSSTKAFYRHMILHSEKGSKSIQLPTTSFEQFQFQVSIAPPAIDLTKYSPLPKSHKTNKRSIRRRNIIDHEQINGAHTLFHISCAAARGGDHGHLHEKLKASSNVDNDKIEKQVSDIDETPATKVKKDNNDNNRKKSLLLRFKVKDNKVVQCIQGEEKKKNNEGGVKQGGNIVLMN